MIMVKGGTSEWPDAGFPGVRINPESLMPQIVNDDALAEALAASDDPGDLVFVRIVEGRAAEAAELLAEARYKDPDSRRLPSASTSAGPTLPAATWAPRWNPSPKPWTCAWPAPPTPP
jgi:hypothetical protein